MVCGWQTDSVDSDLLIRVPDFQMHKENEFHERSLTVQDDFERVSSISVNKSLKSINFKEFQAFFLP